VKFILSMQAEFCCKKAGRSNDFQYGHRTLSVTPGLGAEEGDAAAFVETKDGILISPGEVPAMDPIDRIGKALQKQGITLEELIETGREARGRMVEEEYGLEAEKDA
jgi:hypothetical protein